MSKGMIGIATLRTALAVATCGMALAAAAEVKPQNYYGKIGKRLMDTLPRTHVLQKAFDDEMSQRAWTNLVTYYDYDHSVFLQSDLDKFAARDKSLDDELQAADVSFGFDVYNLYVKRLQERMDFATNLLAKAEWDFSTNETYRVKRKDAPWPKTREEAEDYWRRRMKNELLVQRINKELDQAAKEAKAAKTNGVEVAEKPAAEEVLDAEAKLAAAKTNKVEKVETPEQSLIKKYRQYAMVLTEQDEEEALRAYLSAVSRTYDPHSDYMSPASKEEFDIEMNLSMGGVGAVLMMDDGSLKIDEVVAGGPMAKDGRIRKGDHIIGVQQGDGEMEDITWQPMKKTIRKIRGKKGTRVTLKVIPKSDPSGTTTRLIELVRDDIKLDDLAATGRVERVEHNGVTNALGYVYLPEFYGTMDKRPSDPEYRSCALDVSKYLADFNAQDVKGVVLDLRGNGGGSLREAVALSALFVPNGPVVQIRDVRTTGSLPIMPGNTVAFRKPMVVLIDRASASASEIVAGHLQDASRAVILGDSRSHGKGSVQTVMGLGPSKYGSTKITTARFYRINGVSTQTEGVQPDIYLPSLLDAMDIGEDKLPYAMPFSRILPTTYNLCWDMHRHVPTLKTLSEARLKDNKDYAKRLANVQGMKTMADREEVSLEYEARKAQMAADRDFREGDDDEEDEDESIRERRRKRNERMHDDIVLEEAFRVLSDLIRLNGDAEIPEPKGWW